MSTLTLKVQHAWDLRILQLTLGPGDAGTVQTLHAMRAVVRDAMTHPEVLVRGEFARTLSPEAVWAWVKARVVFEADERGDEWLQHPARLLQQVSSANVARGDCDDRTMLTAAMFKIAGQRVALCAMSQRPGPFVHVLPVLWLKQRWIPFDSQEASRPFVWPVRPVRTLLVEV